MLNDLGFSLAITAPIFCILGFGILFKRIGWISDEFAKIGSELVFRVTLPCLLFVKLVETDFRHDLPYKLVAYAVLATVVVFLIIDRFIADRLQNSFDRGAFVQGAFRGNMGIIGLAFCISAFGDQIVAAASIYLAVLTILFNILAVITLTRHQNISTDKGTYVRIFSSIIKNPLILSILAGVVISLSGYRVPEFFLTTGGYFARMTLPLALLCAGATIRLQEFHGSKALYWSSAGKLIFVPLLMTVGGVLVGLRGEQLGILYLMCAAPTAAASYPMTQAMGGNHHLAAAIIASTSLGSIIFTTLGIFLLRSFLLI
ncbi:MAG: AEC family transporter [Desulfuromusa sp.]|jgi:malonate transporter|nr:AEC family transporter [Desulfuromusa sp.]